MKKQEKKLPGISRQEEEAWLANTIAIAKGKLQRSKSDVKRLAEELHEMLEEFDESDKEMQAMWHNTDARFKQVNQEVRKSERACKKPYFGRIDFTDSAINKPEVCYIGRSVVANDPSDPEVIDWRAPVASVYYDCNLGECSYSVKGEGSFHINLTRKRTYEIEADKLKDFYDSDVVANDELLTKYLAKSKRAVLGEIIATIQQEQNEIIRKKPQHNVLVQGVAGSGKTTVAMHRISYILYNYELEFAPEDFYIIGSNKMLLNYITGVLPELDVYGVAQMTMEQLFVRLLYEDWDKHKYSVKPVKKRDPQATRKGNYAWFHDLEDFCNRYEWEYLDRRDVVLEKTGAILLTQEKIEQIIKQFIHLSMPDKITKLTEHLMANFETEVTGKYYSYTAQEKQRLRNQMERHFGYREWKGSIFDLYTNFLREQNERLGCMVDYPTDAFDVYDLAALAFLYKRIKETEIIREAGHVVIDEAQDFGMMVYGCLKYCLSKCTYTIMGDVSQNIYQGYGLNDWEELKALMIPGEFDYFGLLRKSYRNTIEISDFATNVLHHGSFKIYPVEPIIRHGNPVMVRDCKSEQDLEDTAVEILQGWVDTGMETIAVICRDEAEAELVNERLGSRILLQDTNPELAEFGKGVMVLPIEYTKGLEFDAVLLYNANEENYPAQDSEVKLLYVAATRALHELTVLHYGKLTDLIGKPVPEDVKIKALVDESKPKRVLFPSEPELTNTELRLRIAKEGAAEMETRNYIGPKRIEVNAKKPEAKVGVRVKIGDSGSSKPTKLPTNVPYYLAKKQEKKEEHEAGKRVVTEFGDMPDTASLRPAGHRRIDFSVRWIDKGKQYWDFTSGAGILRVEPVASDLIRIRFTKGQFEKDIALPREISRETFTWMSRENREFAEIITPKITVQVDKKTGAVSFARTKGALLLSEKREEPRVLEQDCTYINFDWGKKETFTALGMEKGEDILLDNAARVISHGRDSANMPKLLSGKGYILLFPPKEKTIFCNIPAYGNYIKRIASGDVEYYFKSV